MTDAAIRAIHQRTVIKGHGPVCEECFRTYPCPTVVVLDDAAKPDGPPADDEAVKVWAAYASWIESLEANGA